MEVLVGTRVVRGPDWNWREQDGGEGHLGTVAEVQVPDQADGDGEKKPVEGGRAPCVVTVQWDCGGRCRYRCGLGGKYDLRVFDSGPAGVVHHGEVCSACGLDPITGIMWKCARCLEYNICTDCYMSGKHFLQHEFDRFVNSRERVRVPARGSGKRREIRGIFKFAEVVPWCDWEPQEGMNDSTDLTGEVLRLCDKDSDYSRGYVEVQWKETDQKTIHMVGHEGKVELKCVEATSGGYYYPDHLPLLGAPSPQEDPSAVSTGDRVRVELEPEVFQAVQEGRGYWNDLMLNVIGKVGTVVGVGDSGDLRIRYPENTIYILCSESVVKVDLPQFKVGDCVRVSGDLEKVQSLQPGHGGWSNAVLLLVGEVGRVMAVYSSGDVLVSVKGKSWVFNPLCLSDASDSKDDSLEDNPVAKWAKEDADESFKYGLKTMLKKGQGEVMFMAVSLGEVEILREFLTKHPEMVNFAADGRTAMHYAATAGLAEAMKILIEFKGDVEQQDDSSTRPLHISVYHGSDETTQLLVDAGADVNARTVEGSTPAMFAAMHGKSRALKVLLRSPNIDVSIQDELGNTALHAAVMSQKLPCIIPLLEAGADPCMLNFSLITPLHYSARMGFLPVVEAFLQNDPGCCNHKDGYSHTIIHCAAFYDHLDIITLAMDQRDSDVDARSDFGQTPLHMALARGNTRSVERLIGYGASVNAKDNEGCTPLHYITTRDYMEAPGRETPVTSKLFKALFGQFIEDPSFVMYGIIAVAALLLRKGADIHATNHSGRSAYQILPFLATLMTVLADYEDIIEEGGHPDGSPLLRLTDKQHATKKSRASAAVLYHETPEEGSTGDYYGGGQHGNRTFMIFSRSPSAYGEGSSTSAHKTESAVFLGTRGKKAGAGGAAGGLAASSSSAGIYQDYGQAYAFPLYDDDPSYMSGGKSKPSKAATHHTTSIASSSAYTTTGGAISKTTAGATGGATSKTTAGATGGATGGATSKSTAGATGGATNKTTAGATTGATAGATSGATSKTTAGATSKTTAGATSRTTGGATAGATSKTTGGGNGSATAPKNKPSDTGGINQPSSSGVEYSSRSHPTDVGSGASRAVPPPASSSSDQQTADNNLNSGEDVDLCFMCDNVVNVKFSPCGHAVMCSACAPKAIRCPVCKIPVNAVYNAVCVNCRKRESEVRQNCGHGMCNSCMDEPVCAGCHEPD